MRVRTLLGLVFTALLRRVVENLLDNALRHTPRGGRILLSGQVQPRAEVRVSNTGRAIPREERGVIFEKFGRARDAIALRGNVGLGLYFCRRAAEAHGGSIRVEDLPGWAVSFVVEMPA